MYLLNENTNDLLGLIRAKMEAKKAPWDKKNPKKYGNSVSKKEKKCKDKKSKHDGKSVLEGKQQLSKGAKVRVKKSHGSADFVGDTGTVDKYVPFGKYYVKLKKNGRSMVAADDLEMLEDLEIQGAFAIGENVVDVLDRIRLEMMSYDAVNSPAAGESGADNETDVDAALDLYLDSIVERLVEKLGASEEQAVEFIMLMADEMEEQGHMPPMPGEGTSDDDVSMWLGAAKTCGFTNQVLDMANAL